MTTISPVARSSEPPEILDFFMDEGLNFSIHAAVLSLRHPEAAARSLSADDHGKLLTNMLDRYLERLDRVRISTLDAMCRSLSAGKGAICTFRDCLGGYWRSRRGARFIVPAFCRHGRVPGRRHA